MLIVPQTRDAIRAAVDSGKKVTCDGGGYEVIKDTLGQYLICCKFNEFCVGLTGQDGTPYAYTLNGENFEVAEQA